MTDAPHPVMVVEGANDGTPYMTITVLCSACRGVVTRKEFDARLDDPRSDPMAALRLGEAHAHAWLEHRCAP
jgi:hypothetical protein